MFVFVLLFVFALGATTATATATATTAATVTTAGSSLANVPMFPSFFDEDVSTDSSSNSNSNQKKIPTNLWIAIKNESDPLPGHLKIFLKRNEHWNITICDNACKDAFMNRYFANTKVLWMYDAVHPLVGAAKADIWRFCVLFMYGGLYIDDDSNLETSLDEIVQPEDSMILAVEGASSMGDCYRSNYHLSDQYVMATFPEERIKATPFFSNYHPYTHRPLFFHGKTLVTWAIFSSPKHVLLKHVLMNMIEIFEAESKQQSLLMLTKWDVRHKSLLCGSTFMLTYSLRELLLTQELKNASFPRICKHDFSEYKGKAKAIWTGNDPTHYTKVMNGLIKQSAVTTASMEETIKHLEHQLVNSDESGIDGKAIHYIFQGKKRPILHLQTFNQLNFTSSQVHVIPAAVLHAIPLGEPLTIHDAELIQRAAEAAMIHHHGHKKREQQQQQHHHNHHSTQTGGSSASESHRTATASTVANAFLSNQVGQAETGETAPKILKDFQTALEAIPLSCYKDDYIGSTQEFLKDQWLSILQQQQQQEEKEKERGVIVYPLCLDTFQLGNTLGNYFNELSCAMLVGADFVAVHKSFHIQDASSLQTQPTHQHSFMNALPTIFTNPTTTSTTTTTRTREEMKRNVKTMCSCQKYCWEEKTAPWLQRLNEIGAILLTAIDAYVEVAEVDSGTILNNNTDMLFVPLENVGGNKKALATINLNHYPYLPLIPDVTIQYRCGDNIGFGKTRYGLLPFPAILKRIPNNAKHIYVIADSPSRSNNHPYNDRCHLILQTLFQHITNRFPHAVVVVKRGGDLFLDMARLAYSNTTICSASTFCLWPAIANQNTVYFPFTPLVANGWSNNTLPSLGQHFHWIQEVEIVKEFKQFKPWNKVIEYLSQHEYD